MFLATFTFIRSVPRLECGPPSKARRHTATPPRVIFTDWMRRIPTSPFLTHVAQVVLLRPEK